MKHGTKCWKLFSGLLPLLYVVAVGGMFVGAQSASADTQGSNVCIQTLFGGGKLNCTANDVQIAGVAPDPNNPGGFLIEPKTCDPNVNGGFFDLTATFQIVTTASERYDIGVYFDINGDGENDGARTGTCSVSKLPIPPAFNLDGDTCGDTVQNTNPLVPLLVELFIPNVKCEGDEFVKLPNCTSWAQNERSTCNTDNEAVPGTTSKCRCDDAFTIPVEILRGGLSVQKDASPSSLDEPGGDVDFIVTVTNTGAGELMLTTITDDEDNDGTVDETYNAADICLETVLASGASTTCTITRAVTGDAGDSFTDNACAQATDNAGPVPEDCDTATVVINDVTPSPTLTKTLEATLCAVTRFKVEAENTSTSEPLQLTALSDSKFGDLTLDQNSGNSEIRETTCVVPQSLAPNDADASDNDKYSCTFVAEVCEFPHTNTASGTFSDGETDTISASGTVSVNSVTVPSSP